MIGGAIAARAMSDGGRRDLASEWGGTGAVSAAVGGARVLRPVASAMLLPRRTRTRI